MADAPDLVASYFPPVVSRCIWHEVGVGFTGAKVWRGDFERNPDFALKRWPSGVTAEHLRQLHYWMTTARTAGCQFVPTVIQTVANDSVLSTSSRCWDVTTWMPGQADFHIRPTSEKLVSVCDAVARLHRAWFGRSIRSAPCPAVDRRLHLLDTWAGRRNSFDFTWLTVVNRAILTRSLTLVDERIASCRTSLRRWQTVSVPVFPCHCDLWHGNVLFEGEHVSAVIDYGALKLDSPAVDLARLLGDFVGPNSLQFDEIVNRYRSAKPPVDVPLELVRVLAETGLVCALANWQLRLSNRVPPNVDQILNRLVCILSALTGEEMVTDGVGDSGLI